MCSFSSFSFGFCVFQVPAHGWISARHPELRRNLRMIDLTDDDVVMDVDEPSTAAAAAPAPVVAAPATIREEEFDRFQLTQLVTMLYNGFLQIYREEKALNNVGEHSVMNYGTSKHDKMMLEIDRYFLDTSVNRIVHADLIRYVAVSDANKMNAFDRVRVHLISLEIERNDVEINRLGLKRKRNHFNADQIACPIGLNCLIKYAPDTIVVSHKCGHLLCQSCLDSRGVCPSCRCEIIRNEVNRIFFKFNHDHDPICRYCDVPFRVTDSDDDWCHILRCGHAYHKICLAANNNFCTACNNINGNGRPQHAYLNF